MDNYFKIICLVITGVILCTILSKKSSDYSLVIIIVLCCGICAVVLASLKPILDFINEMDVLLGANAKWFPLLLKAAGLSFVGEITGAICTEAGHASLAKLLQVLTVIAIVWVSLPLIQNLLDLIQSILEML